MKYLLIGLSLLFSQHTVFGQDNTSDIDISGIVIRLDSLTPIASANIYVMNSAMGVRSSELGLFSIRVSKGDTLVFSAVGSKTTYFVVPDTLKASSYSIIQRMPRDTIYLEMVEISSWPSIEQFNEAFTREFGFDSDINVAAKNANPQGVKIAVENEAYINFSRETAVQTRDYSRIYENAHIPIEDVLNPSRWDKLVQDWKSGRHMR